MKETVWRAKRLTREMQAYWKRYDRVERETRRRQEKEAEEQRKLDGELMEVKLICHRLSDWRCFEVGNERCFVTRKNAVAGVIGEILVGLNLTWLGK